MFSINAVEIVQASICEKCNARFVHRTQFGGPYPWDRGANQKHRNMKWCGGCNADILHDLTEDNIWMNQRPYEFMGFKFKVHWDPIGDCGQVVLWKRLIHPEAANLIYSYHNYKKGSYYGLERGCAWLIAHWWEHALDICPCQNGIHDDAKGSNFREHVMESILWWHKELNRDRDRDRPSSAVRDLFGIV